MMNNNNGADELGKEVRRAVGNVYGWAGFLPAPICPVATPRQELDAYAGRYRRGPDEVLVFQRQADHLVETINAGNGILTYPVGVDTVAFTDFPFKGKFERDATGQISGLRMLGLGDVALMPRLKPQERLPGEWLRAGRVSEAVAGYRAMKLNEYQLTYIVYDLLNARPANLVGAEGLLSLALE